MYLQLCVGVCVLFFLKRGEKKTVELRWQLHYSKIISKEKDDDTQYTHHTCASDALSLSLFCLHLPFYDLSAFFVVNHLIFPERWWGLVVPLITKTLPNFRQKKSGGLSRCMA